MDVYFLFGSDLFTVLILTVIFLLSILWIFRPKSDIPGPTAWPIVGNLFLVEQFNNTSKKSEFVDSLAKKYGSIFRLYLGPYPLVFVQGFEGVNQVLKNRDFIERPSWIPAIEMQTKATGGNGGIVWANGEEWKNVRRFSLQAMRDFGVGKTSIEEKILEEAQNIIEDIENNIGSEITTVKDMMTKASCNVIHSIIFGFRYKHDDPTLRNLLSSMDDIFTGPGVLSASGLFPVLNLLFRKTFKRRMDGFQELKKYVDSQILQHRVTYDPDNVRDFVDIYIKAEMEGSDSKSLFEQGTLFNTILDLFAAGTDTTSTTLDWSILYMIQYPHVQLQCQEEILKVIGPGRMIRSTDRRSLTYIEATLMEIMRLANTAILALPHSSVCETTINGYTVPKNTIVAANLVSAHFDETIWTNPKEFNPNRFLDANSQIINKEYLMPFSTGPRICPGESLAKSELFLIFANLLQRFTFSKVDGDILSFDGIVGITRTAPPYRVMAKQR